MEASPDAVLSESETGASATAALSTAATATATIDYVVQHIVVRSDLSGALQWPMGSVIAQACHASVAVIIENARDPSVESYVSLENIDSMHKVVVEV